MEKEKTNPEVASILGGCAGIIGVIILAIVFHFFPSILLFPGWLLSLFVG